MGRDRVPGPEQSRLRALVPPPVGHPPRAGVEPTFHSRYECKYLINPLAATRVRDFIRPFTEPDAFAAMRKNYRYPVSSLYLDSPDLVLYQQTVGGEKNRFKLRVRTYSDDPGSRAFCEVKWKVNNIVHKRRVGVSRDEAHALLRSNRPDGLSDLTAARRGDAEYFCHLVRATEARPVVRVKYMREAYQSLGDEPARITIDSDLMHSVTLSDDLRHAGGRWVATHCDGLIVEIKFTERFPWWIQDFIRGLSLLQQPVPKYVMSLDQALGAGGQSALSLGGQVIGPRRNG